MNEVKRKRTKIVGLQSTEREKEKEERGIFWKWGEERLFSLYGRISWRYTAGVSGS